MFIPKSRIAIAAGVLVLVGLAAALMHRDGTAPVMSYAPPTEASSAAQPAPYAQDGYYSTVPRPVYVRPGVEQAPDREPNQPVREREYYREPRHRGRSKAHSVEIVAGTATAGAAIGAIAGGGKGAALGALSGGGAGFVYDRLTHNR